MKVTEAEFVQGFIRMCDDGYALGFHERNGGNASYRMKPEEVEQVKDQFTYDKVFTRELWEMMTECPVIFPDGIGVIPWMVPGGRDIAVESSKLMKKFSLSKDIYHKNLQKSR